MRANPALTMDGPAEAVASMGNPEVSIIIPVHNEGPIIEGSIRELRARFQKIGRSFEIIIAENGSTDDTVAIAEELCDEFANVRMLRAPEPNYGAALRAGIESAKGQYVCCDEIDICDVDFHRRALELLVGDDGGFDLVVGSKVMPGARDRRPLSRRAATRIVNGMLRVSLGFRGTDTHGLKAFRRAALLPVVRQCVVDRDMFASELVIRAERARLRLVEIPLNLVEKREPSIHLTKRVPGSFKTSRNSSTSFGFRTADVHFAAITIDVDSLRFYRAIHGLVPPSAVAHDPDPIYSVALPRFFELLDACGIAATLFLIGEDAARHAEAFTPVASTGSEIASHSFHHDYRLSQSSEAAIDADLARAEAALRPLSPSGQVVGFRAPGYNVTPILLKVLVRRGYRYDSSLLPSPLYWAARAAAIGRYRLGRRPSASMVGDPRQFLGPLGPYTTEPTRPWRRQHGTLVEIPMAVHPITRVPLIGTSWAMLPDWLQDRWLNRALRSLPVFNFEMHAIDLLDGTDPGVPAELTRAQPDLRVPVRRKMATFGRLFRTLADMRSVTTLERIADRT